MYILLPSIRWAAKVSVAASRPQGQGRRPQVELVWRRPGLLKCYHAPYSLLTLGGRRAVGWRLIKPSRALALTASRWEPRKSNEPLSLNPLGVTGGRIGVLASAIGPWPRYPRVELDGCGVRAEEASKGKRLRVNGRLRPYSNPIPIESPSDSCIWTDTGAPLPLGANAVAPKEALEIEAGTVKLTSDAIAWRAISLPASDVSTGDPVLVPGRLVTPEAVAGAASLGFKGMPVYLDGVRACIASIGDELVEPWEEGAVKDSNRYQIAARLRRAGIEVVDLGIARDDASEVVRLINEASRRGCDILVTSGGTSVGLSDPVPAAVREEGSILVHGLKIRPGRPTLIGLARGVLVVGLPGNPRSSGNVAENVILPLLTLLSLSYAGKGYVEATLAYTLENRGERTAYIPVALIKARDGLLAVPVARESFMVLSWPLASGTLELRPGAKVEAGSYVEVYAYADSYRAAVDTADSGLTSIDGVPLIKVPAGKEASEAAETAKSMGVPLLSVSGYRGPRTIASRSVAMLHGKPASSKVSVECVAPAGYDQLCTALGMYETLSAPRVESARLMLYEGYASSYVGPLLPWESAERKLGIEYLDYVR